MDFPPTPAVQLQPIPLPPNPPLGNYAEDDPIYDEGDLFYDEAAPGSPGYHPPIDPFIEEIGYIEFLDVPDDTEVNHPLLSSVLIRLTPLFITFILVVPLTRNLLLYATSGVQVAGISYFAAHLGYRFLQIAIVQSVCEKARSEAKIWGAAVRKGLDSLASIAKEDTQRRAPDMGIEPVTADLARDTHDFTGEPEPVTSGLAQDIHASMQEDEPVTAGMARDIHASMQEPEPVTSGLVLEIHDSMEQPEPITADMIRDIHDFVARFEPITADMARDIHNFMERMEEEE